MMHVRHMWMLVSQPYVDMMMCVRHSGRIDWVVGMLVMRVVLMRVCVLYQLVVLMLVLVVLSQMKPHSDCHQEARAHQLNCHRLVEEDHRSDGAQERRG